MANIDASTPQLKAVKKWLDAYVSRNPNNIDSILSKNFKHRTLPDSIGVLEETKEEHIKRYEGFLPTITRWEFDVQEVIEAPGKVVIHATAVCTTAHGVTMTNDSLCIITLVEEDGELKILQTKEFSDPQKYRDYHSAKAAVEKAAAS